MTFNANGIRAAARKGFFDWLPKQNVDIVCVQETKAQQEQLSDPVFRPKGYYSYYVDAERKGYSGVAIYSRWQAETMIRCLDYPIFDQEGRYIEVQVGDFSFISLYLPSGSSKEERQQIKYACMDYFYTLMETMKATGRKYIICGDWNIAHTKEDIKNWRGNQKNSGFLPEERMWFDRVFGELGFIDAFREIEQEEHQYTWWSNRGRAWDNNTGWRLDYQVLSPNLNNQVVATEIYREQRFSDHAPHTIEYDFSV